MNRIFAVSILILSFTGLAFSKILHVPGDYPTIQEAIDAAAPMDTVLVAAGTYQENLLVEGKNILLMSEDGPLLTVIDGGRAGSVIEFGAAVNSKTVMEGFTIRNGSGNKAYNDEPCGGGILCDGASPKIRNNHIIDNKVTYFGGGVFAWNKSHPEIQENLIEGNEAFHGAGIDLDVACNGEITHNIIRNNYSSYLGGGLQGRGSTLVAYNLIEGNEADGTAGGIYCYIDSSFTVRSNIVRGNRARFRGGGIACELSTALIEDNLIEGNIVNGLFAKGGGIGGSTNDVYFIRGNYILNNYAYSTEPTSGGGGIGFSKCDLEVINNVIAGNYTNGYGGGIYTSQSSSLNVVNNTIYGNSARKWGGGIRVDWGGAAIVNSILWNNKATKYSQYSGNTTISYSNVQGGAYGTGKIDEDPLFVDSGMGDFHLTHPSPCRGAGDNNATGLPAEDFEGDPRITHDVVDMGADEYHPRVYYMGEARPGEAITVRMIGYPAFKGWLFMGSGVLDPPQQTAYGTWYLEPPLFSFDTGWITPSGFVEYYTRIPQQVPVPMEVPLQGYCMFELTDLCSVFIDE
ncbi:MAG: right-handed parallel beta-helix repeat-containing protein [Planctomycetota bacterium]|jgi:parallel beta-helix repeat protein